MGLSHETYDITSFPRWSRSQTNWPFPFSFLHFHTELTTIKGYFKQSNHIYREDLYYWMKLYGASNQFYIITFESLTLITDHWLLLTIQHARVLVYGRLWSLRATMSCFTVHEYWSTCCYSLRLYVSEGPERWMSFLVLALINYALLGLP